MKKTLYRLVAWVLLSGLATLGYSQVIENADSTLAQAVAPNADDTPLFLLIGVFVLLVYALVLSYLYFFDARPKLRKKAPTWPTEGVMDPISPPTNIAEKQHLSQQNKQLRRDVRELEELIEKREIEMETMRLELKKRPAAPTSAPPELVAVPPKIASPPPVTRFYLATPNSDGSFVNNPAPQFDPSRTMYEFELNGAGNEAKFSFASDAATIANALSHPDRYLTPACLYPVPPATARNIRTTTPGKARLSPDGQRWLIGQKAQILFE